MITTTASQLDARSNRLANSISRDRLSRGRSSLAVWAVTTVLFCLCGVCTASGEAQFKVGTARAVITPTEPMWMSGYGARTQPADGKLTELWAKALAIEDQTGERLVLVTLDLVGIDAESAKRITERVTERYALPRHAVALSTSHTHSGPVIGENLRPMYSLDEAAWRLIKQYTAQLEETVIRTIGRALDSLEPAQLHWTVGRAHFAVNRRNNAEKEVPQLRQADRLRGPVDHDVPVLVVKDADGAVRSVICGYACHATVLSGYQWSGDWPGYAQLALEARYPESLAMVWAGCGADQNPVPRRELELAKEYGSAIDQAVAAALERPLIPINGTLAARFETLPLKFDRLPSRDELVETATSTNRFEAARARLLLDQWDRTGQLASEYPYPVQTWQLGDGPTWVFLGGEVVVDYALRLKQELTGGRTWVAGYCNDVMAYIASRRVLAEGGYEGGGAMVYYGLPSRWDESIEDDIIAGVRRQVEQLGGAAADAPRTVAPRSYPDHSNVMSWLDQQGELRSIESADQWAIRRSDILVAMQDVMGRIPQAEELPPLEVRQIASEDFDQYVKLLIDYRADQDHEVPAHLYLPKSSLVTDSSGGGVVQKRPAVLALHPTSPLGKDVVAGKGPKANRNYAVELAERGYVVLAPDYPSFGDRADYNFHTDRYLSGTMAGIVAHRRGVDLLAAHELVDPQRIAAIGHSLGGHNAMFVGVFDTRIKAVVSSCGWDPFHDYYGGKLAGWASDRYMPRIRELYGLDPSAMPFDFYEVGAALAPRGFFSCSPLRDSNFDVRGVKRAAAQIGQVYQLLGVEEHFVVQYPDSEHDFPEATRMKAYEFLDRVLSNQNPVAE
jgi:neutral ceramidase